MASVGRAHHASLLVQRAKTLDPIAHEAVICSLSAAVLLARLRVYLPRQARPRKVILTLHIINTVSGKVHAARSALLRDAVSK